MTADDNRVWMRLAGTRTDVHVRSCVVTRRSGRNAGDLEQSILVCQSIARLVGMFMACIRRVFSEWTLEDRA